MRAEAISWDDWSVSNPPRIADDDKWHVQLGPDEVKVVSLEQLDDLFRLSIVDSETQVWQAGMSSWQPLRVIADLDEQPTPTPTPKRAPAKPPAPPTRAASPSVRPAPPAPRPAAPSPSVRPAAPAPRSASPSPSLRPPAPAPRSAPPPAQPAYVAPTSFYPEPVLAAPAAYPANVAYAAPIAFAAPVQAMNSVRPLVVSHAPPPARGGGGFGRFLVVLSLLAGVGITAYRNDFVRDGAHAIHRDALYARLETALGGPAFGTVRALEQSTAAQPAFDPDSSGERGIRSTVTDSSPVSPSAATTSAGTSLPSTAAATPVVSLESLAREQKAQAPAKVEAAAVAATPTRSAVVQSKPAATAAAPKTTTVKNAAPAKAAPAKTAPVEKPAPVSQKPASEMTERERLNAAIGQSMMQPASPKASKSKSKASEYDPLNPTL